MFWSLVSPAYITTLASIVCIVVAVVLAPALGWGRAKTSMWAIFLGFVLFVPSCALIKACIDATRFGEFTYASTAAVDNEFVRDSLPPSATDITVLCAENQHRARFRVKEEALTNWLDEVNEEFRATQRNKLEANDDLTPEISSAAELARRFGDLGWEPPQDCLKLEGPRAANGAGFDVWYSPSRHEAYLWAAYW